MTHHADEGAMRRLAAGIVLCAALLGCAALPQDDHRAASFAFDRPEETSLGRASQAAQARHPELSGFRLINGGVAALMTRTAMADLAERSIDAQYYLYQEDAAGAFLLERLIAAAERGVRVRILLDDYRLGFDDLALAKLVDAHPQIEIRVFNPFPYRARWARPLQLAFDLERLGMRMHNKVFAADGQVAVLGGRNVSDDYFEAQGVSNFRDIDVLATGPIVRDVSRHFDDYWNSPLAVAISAFRVPLAERWGTREIERLRRFAAEPHGPHSEYARRKDEFVKRLLGDGADLVWAKASAIAEQPARGPANPALRARDTSAILRALASVRSETQHEVVMVMAYYVPGKRGIENVSELVRRGVRVRIVYDRRVIWIGSANSDPRSRRLNTEAGLLIESEALAERVLKALEQDFSPQHSWRLALEGEGRSGKRIVWSGEQDGKPVRFTSEPGAGSERALELWFYSILPGIESLL